MTCPATLPISTGTVQSTGTLENALPIRHRCIQATPHQTAHRCRCGVQWGAPDGLCVTGPGHDREVAW